MYRRSQANAAKKCTKCKESKPLDQFYKKGKGLTSRCRVCTRQHSAKWAAENPERYKENQARWRTENREKARQHNAKWAAENRDSILQQAAKVRAEHPERGREYAARWKAKNPDRAKESITRSNHKRRSLHYEQSDDRQLWDRTGGICPICGESLGESLRDADFQRDHTIPASKGGPSAPHNLVLAHPKCNASKGDRLADYVIEVKDPLPIEEYLKAALLAV